MFESPNYTQVPNILFDTYLKLMTDEDLRKYLGLIRKEMFQEAQKIIFKYQWKNGQERGLKNE